MRCSLQCNWMIFVAFNRDCGNTNFAWRNECNRCHTARPESAGGGGGGGMFQCLQHLLNYLALRPSSCCRSASRSTVSPVQASLLRSIVSPRANKSKSRSLCIVGVRDTLGHPSSSWSLAESIPLLDVICWNPSDTCDQTISVDVFLLVLIACSA